MIIVPRHFRWQRGFIIDPYRFAAAVTGDWSSTDKYSGITISGDNVSATMPTTATACIARGNTAWSSGDKYFEVSVTSGTAGLQIGLAISSVALTSTLGTNGNDSVGYRQNGTVWLASTNLGTFASYTAGDIIGVRWNGSRFYFYKNGTAQTNYSHPNIANKQYIPSGGIDGSTGTRVLVLDTKSPFANLPSGPSAWET